MNRRLLVASVVVFVLVADGIAVAYWRGSGGGNSSGATGGTTAISLSPATPTPGLYPGGSTAVALTVTNPNNTPTRIGSLALDTSQGTGGFSIDAGHAGCLASTLSFTTQTTGWTVAAKTGAVNGSLAVTLTGALTMGPAAANACQGASATVYLVAGP